MSRMDAAAKRLESLRQFLAHAHQRLQLDFGLLLWDGSTVPANLGVNPALTVGRGQLMSLDQPLDNSRINV